MEQAYVVVTSGKDLALRLMANGRTKPAAVVSWHPEQRRDQIDVEHIAREVGGLADVFWLENGPESYAFGDSLPAGAHVFGNAARVYSEDLRWLRDVHRSPLRIARDGQSAVRAAEDIIEDVLSLIAVVPQQEAPVRTLPRRVRGAVKFFTNAGSRAVVELGDGSCCTIQREHVVPPVRLDWMLSQGQNVEGLLNEEARTLDINALLTPPRLAALYQPGDLVLALAEEVCASSAKLTLYPGSTWTVGALRISSNPLDTVDSLVTEGEVVVARFLREKGAVALSLIDVDDDEDVKESPALLTGGTPWLRAGRHLAERAAVTAVTPPDTGAARDDPAPAAKPATALRSALLQLDAERRKVAGLQELVASSGKAGAELVSLHQSHDDLRQQLEAELALADELHGQLEAEGSRADKQLEELRNLRTRKRETQRALQRAAAESDGLFETPAERLRHDVYLSWVKSTPSADKARLALPLHWTAGPDFADTLYSFTEPGVVSKALKAVAEVLTGAAERNPARELHALRVNSGGDSPQVVRADGARCFRAAVEKKVASARRLHFWRLPDGTIELSRVVVHDDCRP
ncbi:hypothetical protein BJG92_01171 [Arthrobacter sp. SO5]|uniref:hypothetical protein n=1 Tax=Arthrobacter sp. SO5 TaxID=1897055 RepID=UPI001E4179BF|nr:hypothetical protein [Arthrobacter sp. SO5]MCB5273647.1 hypothetical protein [Arthrobacter sp. SO5]